MPRSEIPQVIQNPTTGESVSGASITITVRGTNAAADVYTQETGSAKFTQPLQSGNVGQVTGWLEDGSYKMSISGAGLSPFEQSFEAKNGVSTPVDPATFPDGSIPPAKLQSVPLSKLAADVLAFLLPSGSVLPYAGNTAPTGFLLANGAAVSRTTYSALFAVCGEAFGAGNGSSTFNVPDLRSRLPLGAGAGPSLTTRYRNDKGGSESETLTNSQMPVHNHGGATPNATLPGYLVATLTANYGFVGTSRAGYTVADTVANDGPHVHGINSDGGGAAHNNMPPYIALNYIIKT